MIKHAMKLLGLNVKKKYIFPKCKKYQLLKRCIKPFLINLIIPESIN